MATTNLGPIARSAQDARVSDHHSDVQVVVFGVAAIALSWLLWSPLVADRWGWIDGASPYWHLAGGVGPAFAALALTAAFEGRAGLRLLFRRMFTGPGRWLLGVLVAPLVMCLLALGIARLAGVRVDLTRLGASKEFPDLPLPVFWFANLAFYGYGEEVGWRGFALPRLQRSRSALSASMWLAVLWALWHLPLFVFSAGLSTMAPVGLIGWGASMVTGSLICTWLFNSTGGSIAVLAVFHAALDVFIGSPTGGEIVANVMGSTIVIAALTIPRKFGRQNLAHAPKVTTTR